MQQTNGQSSEPTENTVSVDTAYHLYAAHAMDGLMSQKTARSEARSEAQTRLLSNLPTCPQKTPQSLLGVTIFSEKLFSHYGLLYFL